MGNSDLLIKMEDLKEMEKLFINFNLVINNLNFPLLIF
jgi:hypothetical protein